MKVASIILAMVAGAVSVRCGTQARPVADFSAVSRVDSGPAIAVMLTAYSTTLRQRVYDEVSTKYLTGRTR